MRKLLFLALVALGVASCQKDTVDVDVLVNGAGPDAECFVQVNGEDVPCNTIQANQPTDNTVTFNFAQSTFVIGKNASSSKIGDEDFPHFWPNEDVAVTFTESQTGSVVTTDFNPSTQAQFSVELPAGRWGYEATSSNYDAVFTNAVGFTVSGTVVAYGQSFTTTMTASTNHGFVSIESAEICSAESTNGSVTHEAGHATDIIVDRAELPDARDIYYFYVLEGTAYSVNLGFESVEDSGNCDSIGVAEDLAWEDHTHYHYNVDVDRSTPLTTGTYTLVLETFNFRQGTLEIGGGEIDLNFVFGATGCDEVWDFTYDEDRNIILSHDNHANTLHPDGNTPMQNIEVRDESGTVVESFSGEEATIVQQALDYVCGVPQGTLRVNPETSGGFNTWLVQNTPVWPDTADIIIVGGTGNVIPIGRSGVSNTYRNTLNNTIFWRSGSSWIWQEVQGTSAQITMTDAELFAWLRTL